MTQKKKTQKHRSEKKGNKSATYNKRIKKFSAGEHICVYGLLAWFNGIKPKQSDKKKKREIIVYQKPFCFPPAKHDFDFSINGALGG